MLVSYHFTFIVHPCASVHSRSPLHFCFTLPCSHRPVLPFPNHFSSPRSTSFNRNLSEIRVPQSLDTQRSCSLTQSLKSLNPNSHSHVQRIKTVSTALFSDQSTPDFSRPSNAQVLHVYEINERDRSSPAYLRLSQKETNSLGDLVPFTNKLYSGNLEKRLGITSGITILIKSIPEKGDRYEAMFSFYFGEYGHISVQGCYLTYEDTYLAITGGTGVFAGVYGQVLLHQIAFPFKIFYTFYLKGIPELPGELICTPVPPSATVKPTQAAIAAESRSALRNYTD